MAVFLYEVSSNLREGFKESGTIRARDEREAKYKLTQYGFGGIRLERIRGIRALRKWFTADIK